MTPELLKELEDAGFPIKEKLIAAEIVGNELHKIGSRIPSLEELIEACGEDLSHIKQWNNHWWAVTHTKFDENGNNYEECAVTPTEAVARLWLDINKKLK